MQKKVEKVKVEIKSRRGWTNVYDGSNRKLAIQIKNSLLRQQAGLHVIVITKA